MRSENIKVKFTIPFPCEKPDLNGNVYTKEAIENACKNLKNIPIGIYDDDGQFIPIGVTQDTRLIKDGDSFVLSGVGSIFHGGTDEMISIENGKIVDMRTNAIGFTTK